MKKSNTDFLAVLCYIVLIIAAFILLFNNLLPVCGVEITGNFWSKLIGILDTVKDVCLLVALAMGSYVVSKKGKAWLIIYIIAVIIFAVAIVLAWF